MEKKNCNLCGREVSIFYELENYPLYTRPVRKEYVDKVTSLPLKIGFCFNCNHILQIDPPLNELDMVYKVFYESHYAPSLTGINAESANVFVPFLSKEISGNTLLEIGSGDGYFLNIMRNKGWDVYGCDPSPQSDIAIEKYNIPVKKELFSRNLFNQKFDCVVMRHVLEHIVNPTEFLEEVSTVLKPDGFLAIEVPNGLYILEEGIMWGFYHEHISYFTPYSLSKIITGFDFSIISMKCSSDVIYLIARYTNIKNYNINYFESEIIKTKRLINEFVEKFKILKKQLIELNKELSSKNYDVYIYGAGTHSTLLLSIVQMNIKALIDKNESLWEMYLPLAKGIEIVSPNFLKKLTRKDAVIISSYAYQEEIINELKPYGRKGVKIIKLYPEWEYVKY
jgi:2-polyprenyl-3-methyl-5-hydroxy-6-metoxy-1,4-benzoquinol methylase